MIVANKIDLRDQARAEGKRVIEQNEGLKLAKVCFKRKRKRININYFIFLFQEHKALFIETSAKDGTNSDETLIELARYVQNKF